MIWTFELIRLKFNDIFDKEYKKRCLQNYALSIYNKSVKPEDKPEVTVFSELAEIKTDDNILNSIINDEELDETLLEAIMSSGKKLVLVVGETGAGKTTLGNYLDGHMPENYEPENDIYKPSGAAINSGVGSIDSTTDSIKIIAETSEYIYLDTPGFFDYKNQYNEQRSLNIYIWWSHILSSYPLSAIILVINGSKFIVDSTIDECLEAVAFLAKISEFFTNSEFIEDKHLLNFLHNTNLTTLAIRRNNRILHYTGRRKIIELYNQLTKECFALISKNLDCMPDELRDTFLINYVEKGNKRQRTRL